MDWGRYPDRDEEHGDYRIAQAAIAAINNAPENRPFFIACGFRLPHVPCLAPPKWFEPFPLDSLILPQVKDNERAHLPSFAWRLHWRLPEPRLSTLRDYDEWKPLVRAYLASIHFMDAQVGRVLDALKKSGKAENTLIVLWSDHGYHLGEKEISGKNTLWERSTRVPLIFAGPGVSRQGRCLEPVELLDIYPTLVEMCSLAKVEGLEGHSLQAQLKDSRASRPWPAITTHNKGNHAIRTRDHRYIRYADGSEELYDHRNDPREWTNLAAKPEAKPILAELSRWLPKVDVLAAPGSKHRVLTYDPATGLATWEGKQVKPGDLPPGP
jgi:arylsulfatase A-like enzyme